jgi:hypothetical protein
MCTPNEHTRQHGSTTQHHVSSSNYLHIVASYINPQPAITFFVDDRLHMTDEPEFTPRTRASQFTMKQSSESHQHTAAIHPLRYGQITGSQERWCSPHDLRGRSHPHSQHVVRVPCISQVLSLLPWPHTHTARKPPADPLQETAAQGSSHADQTNKAATAVADLPQASMQVRLQLHMHIAAGSAAARPDTQKRPTEHQHQSAITHVLQLQVF